MSDLDDLMFNFREEVEGFISTDFLGTNDGISIAGSSVYHDFDSDVASVEFASVCQSSISVMKAVGDPTLEDIPFITANVYILVRFMKNQDFYNGLAINKANGNLGRARLIMRNFENTIINSIPK